LSPGFFDNATNLTLVNTQNHMSDQKIDQIIYFLRQDLSLPDESVELALKQAKSSRGSLPIVLWQYGLVTLQQLDRIYDWFESYVY
jgi:Protein of unknown function (DUF2949)